MLKRGMGLPSGFFDSIRSGMRVFVHGGAATPSILLNALVLHAESKDLRDIELIHLHTEGKTPYDQPGFRSRFKVANLFVGPNVRGQLDYDRVDYLPCFLSEIPMLFRSGRRPVDAALLHVSQPDAKGFCSLGVSVDVALAAAQSAGILFAQVNRQMPRVLGDGLLHIDDFDAVVEVDTPLPEARAGALTEADVKIGQWVATLVEDGATLQVGIGAIPDAVLAALKSHRFLGLHSEMWSDHALDLIESGAIDNSKKAVHPGKTVSSFVIGSKRLYSFVHDNVSVAQLGADYVNSPQVIARNPKVTAINSAVQLDLTGQVCADSVGSRIISGVGGQMDFMRGAALSDGGKPILAFTSRTKKGIPRIVPTLEIGAGVVTTRAHVHYVVTEYGIADLFGKTLGERARAMISIAHPDDREYLQREWRVLHS